MNSDRLRTDAAPQLRIGVSGHRASPKLPDSSLAPLRSTVDRILRAIADLVVERQSIAERRRSDEERRDFPQSGKAVAVVSSLAEGSDRIVAEAGLAAGCELQAILPFSRAEYTKDFATQNSRSQFEQLLSRASRVWELPGEADKRPSAYEAAGLRMLAEADLLIAIWDGERASGVGGTAEIVARALADGVPIVRIDPVRTNAIQMAAATSAPSAPPIGAKLGDTFLTADEKAIALLIRRILSSKYGISLE